MGIVQVGHDNFRRLATHARDRLQQLHALVSARYCLELLVDLMLVLTEVLQLDQLLIQLATPQVVQRAIGQRLTVLGNQLQAFQRPHLLTTHHLHPPLSKDGADVVLYSIDAAQDHLAILHQPAIFALLAARNVDGHQLPQRGQLSQLERIVAIRLALMCFHFQAS